MLDYIKIAILGASALVGLAATYIFKMKPDNKIEEVAEQIIKKQSGVDIDLSPKSKEKDNNENISR